MSVCEYCWREAQLRHANGHGEGESVAEVYGRLMDEHATCPGWAEVANQYDDPDGVLDPENLAAAAREAVYSGDPEQMERAIKYLLGAATVLFHRQSRRLVREGVVVDAAKCPECDGITLIDEDGCCRTCGADTEPCKARLIGPLEEAE